MVAILASSRTPGARIAPVGLSRLEFRPGRRSQPGAAVVWDNRRTTQITAAGDLIKRALRIAVAGHA